MPRPDLPYGLAPVLIEGSLRPVDEGPSDASILRDHARGVAAKIDSTLTAAQAEFRHKTRKQPFATLLNLGLAWNIVAISGWNVLRLT